MPAEDPRDRQFANTREGATTPDALSGKQQHGDCTFLLVPFREKHQAAAAGARWDGQLLKWYVPPGRPLDRFERWLPAFPDTSTVGPRLTIELVPQTCWFSNVRSNVSEAVWGRLKRATFAAAAYHCEVCGGQGRHWPVECHEVWDYDDERHIQRLVRLIALCPPCHEVKHIGFASVRGVFERAAAHLAAVNRWPLDHALTYVDASFAIWEERSEYDWELDISWLESAGVSVRPPDR